ncbi:MAG: orotidine-5'-phosphate decarboxylase [Spirochaetes bacterium]|nr:orotidine-5'-phosphate decarboxylase [Spirochaetota bacterium]
MPYNFREKLAESSTKSDSLLCIGLDPDISKMPEAALKSDDPLAYFCTRIVMATKESACAYKPNFAFFESMGIKGRLALEKVIKSIPREIPVILDAKVGDIGNTSAHYARAFFEELNADALTVNPYMGIDSVSPFLEYENKGVFFLCLTSNKGSMDLQKEELKNGEPVYIHVAKKIKDWDAKNQNCCAVVGATNPQEMQGIRNILDTQPVLVPGIGAQGGDLEAVCRNIITGKNLPTLISASRSIIYASAGDDFEEAANISAESLRKKINDLR